MILKTNRRQKVPWIGNVTPRVAYAADFEKTPQMNQKFMHRSLQFLRRF